MARVVAPSDGPRTRLYRRGPGERWWFALLLLPTVLTGLVVLTRTGAIQDDIQHRTLASLRAEGLAGTSVAMDGRTVTLRVPTGESEKKAVAVAEEISGVEDVKVEHVAKTKAEARACDRIVDKLHNVGHGFGILFSGASTHPTASGSKALNVVTTLLQRCPSVSVVAEGHVDSAILNASTLSLRRAQAIKTALVKAGIRSGRIQTQGYGDAFPATADTSSSGRALNNRVEVKGSEDN